MFIFDLIRPIAVAAAARMPAPSLDVARVSVRIRDLPPALDGFTMAQISDLHVGDEHWGPEHLNEVAAALHDLNPDIVVNTGDFLEGEPPLPRVRDVVKRLMLPGESRNFAVLGNHDYVAGEEMVADLKAALGDLGVRVLENDLTCLRRDGAGLSLAGLSTEAPGWDQALQRLVSSDRPRVVMIHIPDCAEQLPDSSADLILSGHTHGGQIAIPGLEKVTVRSMCGSNFVEGMYEVGGSPLYVNRGLGCVGLPARFRANPELTILTLVR